MEKTRRRAVRRNEKSTTSGSAINFLVTFYTWVKPKWTPTGISKERLEKNKLASLGATLVRNYDLLTYLLTY